MARPHNAWPVDVAARPARMARLAGTGVGRTLRLPVLITLSTAASAAFAAASLLRRPSGPRIVRWYFETAGGGVVKIGQLLATRVDLLPPEYCEELGRLLDDLPPVPADRIIAVVERSLGSRLGELFSDFDEVPIATASLAQVHGAVLWSGERVAVKVLKPGIRQLVGIDMWFMRVAAWMFGWLPLLANLDIPSVVKELCRIAAAELDLQREATALALFHAAMAKDELAHSAPAPFRELCTPEVLTMERVSGVAVRDILTAMHRGNHAQLREWACTGITPQGVARLLFRSVLEQSMRHRMFNADPHPSNLIIGERGQLNWVDFGLVGWMDERQWSLQLRLRQAFARGQVHGAYRLFVESVAPLPRRDLRGFETEMKEAIHNYIMAARDPAAPLSQRSTGAFLIGTLGALRRHHLPISTSTIQLYRAILIADVVMLRLDPQVDWLAEMEDFLVSFVAEQAELAVRATADPFTFSSVMDVPSTALDAIEWVERRLMRGASPTSPTSSVTDEFLLGLFQLIRLAAVLALLAAVLIAVGAVNAPASGLLAGYGRWVANSPAVACVLLAVGNVLLQLWSRRFRR